MPKNSSLSNDLKRGRKVATEAAVIPKPSSTTVQSITGASESQKVSFGSDDMYNYLHGMSLSSLMLARNFIRTSVAVLALGLLDDAEN